MSVPYRKIHVVINPAAGKDEPILNTINKVFHKYEIDWQVSITKKFGDATRLAKQAIANGVDLVAGYGGDGTQMEIANAVMGSNTPMAILPGGTGNAMSFELNVPRELEQAAELICQSSKIHKIDVARIEDQHFMLRAYSGIEESEKTSRENNKLVKSSKFLSPPQADGVLRNFSPAGTDFAKTWNPRSKLRGIPFRINILSRPRHPQPQSQGERGNR